MRTDILTLGGRYFDFNNPEDGAINIDVIAHALSHICRFTGHVRTFYSVAQHSVLVSEIVSPEHAFAGLMHDAAEAFIGDVSAPLKQLLPDYKALEKIVEAAVLGYFGLPAELPAEVKHADLVLLMTEQRDLMPAHDDVWHEGRIKPLERRIVPVSPQEARRMFLMRFDDLYGGRQHA